MPVVKIIKLKVTYVPFDLTGENKIVNLEINMNDNLCVADLEKIIKEEIG